VYSLPNSLNLDGNRLMDANPPLTIVLYQQVCLQKAGFVLRKIRIDSDHRDIWRDYFDALDRSQRRPSNATPQLREGFLPLHSMALHPNVFRVLR